MVGKLTGHCAQEDPIAMIAYLQRRLLHSIVVFVVVCTLTFVLIRMAPGLPQIMTGDLLTNEDRQLFRENLGLDRPIFEQYFVWWNNLIRGDLGTSWTERAPVLQVLLDRLPNTMLLLATSLSLAIILGIPIGILSAVRRFSVVDYLISTFSIAGLALPTFWLALLLIMLFSVQLQVLPSAGMRSLDIDFSVVDRIRHLILPTIVLSTGILAQLVRYTRSSMLEILENDYVRTARAKGLTEVTVLSRHALKNALIPVITVIGLQIPRFIGGSIIVETIFAWPGIGRLAYNAAITRDYPLIMGVTLLVAVVVLLSNLLTDLAYTLVNPRIKLS